MKHLLMQESVRLAERGAGGWLRHGAWALALIGVGLLGAACQKKVEKVAPPPPEVVTVTLAAQPLQLTSELPGRTAPFCISEIRPQVSGIILKRLFTEGADVKAGQELYQIDPAPFQAALDNAQAAMERTAAQLPALQAKAERMRQALADKSVSQQDVDDAVSALDQARADLRYWQAMVATARINLGYTRIVAPIEGRIGRSSFTEGAIVTAYQPEALATIQQLDPIYVDVPQSTTEMTRLRRRMEQGRLRIKEDEINRVKLVLVEDNSIYPLEGTLQFHDVTVDPTTGSVILRMVFPNPKHELLPGMYVRALVREGINDQAILAPQEGVARNPKGESYALIVDGQDKVQQRILALDRAVSNQWLIASGLQAGDRVIVEGLQRVKPGETARVVSPAN